MNTKYYHYSAWDKLNDLGFFTWFAIFTLSTGLIAIERFTPVYINNFYVRLTLYIVSATIAVSWIAWLFLGHKAIKNRIYIFGGVLALVLAKAYFTWGGDWKTQIVLYRDKVDNERTIEFQMRADPFAFGYKKRIVERLKIAPFVDHVTKIDTMVIDRDKWTRTDERVNELKLDNFDNSELH